MVLCPDALISFTNHKFIFVLHILYNNLQVYFVEVFVDLHLYMMFCSIGLCFLSLPFLEPFQELPSETSCLISSSAR